MNTTAHQVSTEGLCLTKTSRVLTLWNGLKTLWGVLVCTTLIISFNDMKFPEYSDGFTNLSSFMCTSGWKF